jgi:hypothetical protein
MRRGHKREDGEGRTGTQRGFRNQGGRIRPIVQACALQLGIIQLKRHWLSGAEIIQYQETKRIEIPHPHREGKCLQATTGCSEALLYWSA